MAIFRKKADPISDRARTLNSEIAALEEQIRKYESRLSHNATEPKSAESPFARSNALLATEPISDLKSHQELELTELDRKKLVPDEDLAHETIHINELGVQKYDLPGLISKLKSFFKAPTTSNPKLVSYLAAGGIQGLRPLRYEKRVARNRFIVFVVILFLLLLGMLTVFVPR